MDSSMAISRQGTKPHRRHRKESAGDIVGDVLKYLIAVIVILVSVLPMWDVLMASFSDPFALMGNDKFLFWPTGGFSVKGYEIIFSNTTIFRGYLNTILYTLANTVLGIVLGVAGAYVLTRKNLMLKKFLTVFTAIPLLLTAGLIPTYMVVHDLGMTDTVWAMIIPTCLTPMNIFLLMKGIEAIPSEILESAQVDGAGHLRILFRIVVPLVVPYIGVVAMFSIVAQWNSWMLASVYLSDESSDLYPLALIIREIVLKSNVNRFSAGTGSMASFYKQSIQMCSIIVSSLPLLIIFPFFQKYFEKAVIIGAVKG